MNLVRIALALVFFVSSSSMGLDYRSYNNQQILTISPQIALPIGIKIWFNESGGSVLGLTAWNDGEDFASLGIGHFIWHPYPSKQASLNTGFPHLLLYIASHGVALPSWLHNAKYCPWSNRNQFLSAIYSPKMRDLRLFLKQTIPLQAQYMAEHLQEILPELLASTPPKERPLIYQKFYSLARTPSGIYALVDYLNFKGAGISNSLQNYKHGTGLLHVLKGMGSAPPGYTTLQAYVWSAKHALIRRVERSSSTRHDERWLAGWFNRVNTYLDGDNI